MEPRDVNLYVYDISKGLARQLSQALVGKQLDGIWHTSVVIFGREYFFGGGGIESCRPGGTILGPPDQVHRLGETQVTYSLFLEYLGEMGMTGYGGDKYNLFDHNCNNFSNDVSQFLTGNPIPSYITDLPHEVLDTPIGAVMKPILDSLASNPTGNRDVSSHRPTYDPVPLPSAAVCEPTPRSVAKGQSPVNAGTGTQSTSTAPSGAQDKDNGGEIKDTRPATEGAPSGGNDDDSDDSDDLFLQKLRQRRQQTAPTRLCLFKEANPVTCADSVKKHLPESLLSADELAILEQMKVAFVAPSDSLLDNDWDKVLPPIKPEYFLVVGKLLGRTDLPPMVLLPLLQLLQLAFLREDVIGLLCTNDDHTIIDFVSRCECQTQKVQIEILHLLCNMCRSRQGYAWLMSNKEWAPPSSSGPPASNSKIIKAILIPMLLSGTDELCGAASSLVYNFSRYQVSDDHAVDFASAILQTLTTAEFTEPTVFYSVSALYGLMQFGEVICLANIMGFDLDKYVGLSDRMNQLILDMGVIIGEK